LKSAGDKTDKSVELAELCWPEVKHVLRSVRLAVIPTGSTEQHGPHMTLETDTALAVEFARRLAARFPGKVLVTPPINIGLSSHHMRFSGSMTIQPETFFALGRDMVASLATHGLRKFLFLNGHGGNRAALTTLCTKLRTELGVEVGACTWFVLVNDLITRRVGSQRVHACEIEASAGLFLTPRIVRKNKLTKGREKPYRYRYTHPRESWSVEIPYRWDELTDNGAFGDASKATVETGEELCEMALERLSRFVKELLVSGKAAKPVLRR
jgi:creatinine amidohydrolase